MKITYNISEFKYWLRKQNVEIFISIALFISMLSFSCHSDMSENGEIVKVSNLRCELTDNPIGIDIRSHGLSWVINSAQRNVSQKAYQVLVATDPDLLEEKKADVWNSGKIKSDQSVHVSFNGKELKSNTTYVWKVRIWTDYGESEWSEPAKWHVGYLYFKDWKGRWIGLDRSFPWDREEKFSKLSARYFRKEFSIPQKKIEKATLYIMGLGLYELYINGEKISNQVLAPSPTDYTKNVKYNTFDVTTNIHTNKNAIGVVLGNGRYYNPRQNYKPYKIKTFGYPKMLLNLIIEYKDGSTETIITDNSWKVTADGPIRSNNEYDGEIYNAGKEMPGWNMVGFKDEKWISAEYVQEPGGDYEAQLNENMEIMDTISPVSIKEIENGRYILDMGQNFAGWLRMKVNGNKGDKVTLRFAESLKVNGEIFTENLRDAKATDEYILKGGSVEIWEPSFVFHGFRFVEITGFPGKPELQNFTGCVVYDKMKTSGHFETSNELINQIYKNAFWSVISTYKGMPIDCPQRNERQPWLGDRAMGSFGESFMVDNCQLYIKWLDDIKNTQKEDGSLSDVAPPYFRYYSDNMTWPGTYLLVAQMLYQQFGLKKTIQEHYPFMKKWLYYMMDKYMDDYILTKDSYGDWCAPPATIEEGRGKSADVKKPSSLISTAYLYYYLQLMQDFAIISGQNQDIKQYQSIADSVKLAFNQEFLTREPFYYGNNTLTENILPLYFGMVPQESKDDIVNNISHIIIDEYQGHLSTGLVGVQWLMRTLSNHHLEDIAYKLVTNTSYPSWGYMVDHGATTIWELWNANTAAPSMNSQNHVMLIGDLVIWFYENLAGIKSDPQQPGFKKIIMNPIFYEELDFVNASFQSVCGEIISHWEKSDNVFRWKIKIATNTTANVYFPFEDINEIMEKGNKIFEVKGIIEKKVEDGKTMLEIGSGTYEFEIYNN